MVAEIEAAITGLTSRGDLGVLFKRWRARKPTPLAQPEPVVDPDNETDAEKVGAQS